MILNLAPFQNVRRLIELALNELNLIYIKRNCFPVYRFC